MFQANVIFENSDYIAFDKPSGIHSVSICDSDCSMEKLIRAQFPECILANRLDFYTSGILLAAKRAESVTYLRQLFSTKQIFKSYAAVVSCSATPSESYISTGYLYSRYSRSKKVLLSKTNRKGSEYSECKINTLFKISNNIFVVKVDTFFGYRHVVRVHLAHNSIPLLNDSIYSTGSLHQGFFLRAHYLKFDNIEISIPWRESLASYKTT